MEKTVQIFQSFAEAEKAEKEYYRSLSPQKRIEILLELRDQWRTSKPNESTEGFKRVYRITKLEYL
jgi:hypothetical protein